MRERVWPAPALAGLLSLACYAGLQSTGVTVLSDGWAYWQGAVSLVEGRGYRYFSGDPIVMWPPLYSLYLGAWIPFTGATTRSLAAANAVLIVLQAVLWTWCLLQIWRQAEGEPPRAARFAVAAYLGFFLPLHQQFVLSEVLKYTLLAPFVWTMWQTAFGDRESSWRWAWANASLGALLLATHHGSICFVTAAATVVLWRGRTNGSSTAIAEAAVVLLLPLASWALLRDVLDQWGSHPVGWTAAQDSPLNYLRETVRSISYLLNSIWINPPRLGLIPVSAVMLLIATRGVPLPLATGVAFAALAAAQTLGLFSVTWVMDPVDPRFLLFVPLLIVPMVFLTVARWPQWSFRSVVVLSLAPLAIATLLGIRDAQHPETRDRDDFLRYDVRISSQYREGSPIDIGDERLTAPAAWRMPDHRARQRP